MALGIDSEALASPASLRQEYGDIAGMHKPNGRLAYFINDPLEVQRIVVRRHRKYIKSPFILHRIEDYWPNAEDIVLKPELRH